MTIKSNDVRQFKDTRKTKRITTFRVKDNGNDIYTPLPLSGNGEGKIQLSVFCRVDGCVKRLRPQPKMPCPTVDGGNLAP